MAKAKVGFEGRDDAERVIKATRYTEELMRRSAVVRPLRPGAAGPVLVRATTATADGDGLYAGVFVYFDPEDKTFKGHTDTYNVVHTQCLIKFASGQEPTGETVSDLYVYIGVPQGPDLVTAKMVVYVGSSPSSSDNDISGCASLAFIEDTDCISFLVLASPAPDGLCSTITTGQESIGVGSGGVFSGEEIISTSTDDWIPRYYIPDCDYPNGRMTLTKESTLGSSAEVTVCGVFLRCGKDNSKPFADFAFGGTVICDGGTPVECSPGMFVIRVRCLPGRWWCVDGVCVKSCLRPEGAVGEGYETEVECVENCCGSLPNPNYAGPGWYCKCDNTVAEYLTDPFSCVCLRPGGPYADEAAAEAACTPLPTLCCGDAPATRTATITATGGCAILNGSSFTLARDPLPADQNIYRNVTLGSGNCFPTTLTWNCSTKVLSLVFGADNTGSATLVSESCDPFEAVYELTLTFSAQETCCSGAITVTITE